MGVTAEALAVLLFLLPGFLASKIIGAIATRRAKRHVGEIIIEALILSFLFYAALDMVGWGVITWESESVPRVEPGRAWRPLVLAILFALLNGASINRDWHMRFLRLIRVTNKTARAGMWLDVFASQRAGVLVSFADGRRLMGWPAFYSDNPEEGLLYLRSPAWLGLDDKLHAVKADGILIDVRDGVDFIQFQSYNM